MKPRMLLHVCCGPCSTHVIQELLNQYQVTVFFYNPNIFPSEEYDKRLEAAHTAAKKIGVDLVEGPYDPKGWQDFIAGQEEESEGGRRCELCYEYRLRKTAEKAGNFDIFTTTLTVSPHKKSEIINRIGKNLERKFGVKFLEADFKKQDGFGKSVKLSKEMHLYRQTYCGCQYSLRRSIASPKL